MNFNDEEFEICIWKNEKLGKYVAIDTETTVVPFHMTPDVITIQAYGGGNKVYYVPKKRLNLFLNMHFDSKLIMHNAPFDLGTLSKYIGNTDFVYDLYDRDRIQDTSILYRLLHLATAGFIPFKFNLALLTEMYLKVELDKNNDVRCNFEQFKDTEIKDIPMQFLEYGAIDAIATFQIYFILQGHIKKHDKYHTQLSHNIQVKGDWALSCIYKNGIGFDLKNRDVWLKDIDKNMLIYADQLATWGWVRGTKGIKERYEIIMNQLGIADKLPKTKDGSISSSADDLLPYKKYQFVNAYLEYLKLEKASSFVRGIESNRIHPRYQTLKNTGRTSCSKPNIQQLPRLGGIRELFVPVKKDNVFIITDYSALELCSLAQVLYHDFGTSKMQDLINNGVDLHKYAGSVCFNKKIEEVTKDERQLMKCLNFGYGANMSPTTFVEYAAGSGFTLTESESYSLKAKWTKAYPEMNKFWNVGDETSSFTLTGRKRANCSYTAYLNTKFQGLAADGAKVALYNLCKAGFILTAFVHDEVVCEVPKDKAEELLKLQEKILIDSMQEILLDVGIKVESMITKTYTK